MSKPGLTASRNYERQLAIFKLIDGPTCCFRVEVETVELNHPGFVDQDYPGSSTGSILCHDCRCASSGTLTKGNWQTILRSGGLEFGGRVNAVPFKSRLNDSELDVRIVFVFVVQLLQIWKAARMATGTPGLKEVQICLLYTSPSPRDATLSRMPSSA